MNGKIVIAFASGALIASGIVYVAVKPAPLPKPAKPAVITPTPAKIGVATPAPATPAAPAPVAPVAAARVGTPRARVAVVVEPVREKPSPLSPRGRDKPLTARNEIPPVPVQPAPAPPVDTPAIPSAPAPAPEPPPAPAPTTPPSPQPVLTPETAPEPPPVVAAPAPVPVPAPEPERVPHTVTIAAGTTLPVRIGESLSSARNQAGDSFLATLDQPLVVDGFIIAERGARVEGRVTDADQAGRGRGVSHLRVALVRLATSDGQNIRIQTDPYQKEGTSSTGNDAAKIGGGAAIGAIIGAIAGGGKGAAIGAGVGGAAGAGDVLLTRAKPAEIKVETRLTFRVHDPVTITERLD